MTKKGQASRDKGYPLKVCNPREGPPLAGALLAEFYANEVERRLRESGLPKEQKLELLDRLLAQTLD